LSGPEKNKVIRTRGFYSGFTSTTVLVLLAWVSVLKVVHGTGVESEKMDVDEEEILRERLIIE